MLKKMVIWIALIVLVTACSPVRPYQNKVPAAPTLKPSATTAPDTGPDISEFMQTELVDVNSDSHFKLSDFPGKVVLVEGIATWCPTCFKEALTLKTLHAHYGQSSDFISVSIGLDLREDAATLKSYAQQFGFNWAYCVAPLPVAHYMGNKFGALFIDPTLVPMVLIDRQRNLHPLQLGYKSEDDLMAALDPYLKAGTN
jgi:thiol-disulfide isomerase/thioredoxin